MKRVEIKGSKIKLDFKLWVKEKEEPVNLVSGSKVPFSCFQELEKMDAKSWENWSAKQKLGGAEMI